MVYSAITYSLRQHVAGITLNRPDADNVIDLRLATEIEDACHGIAEDDDVRVVVITGTGDGAFCGGGEIEGLAGDGRELTAENRPYRVAEAVAGLGKPVIAAINGDALGQGLELALACDIRLAASQARLGFPQVEAGLIPMDGGTQRLPRIVGRGKALEMVLSGEPVTAEEALAIGLVSKVVAGDDLAAEAEALADSLASKAPMALRFAKEAITKGMDLTLDQGLRLEGDLYFLLHTTADRTEGIRAFLEKRTPRFKGE